MTSVYTPPFRIGAFEDWRRIIRDKFLPIECVRDRTGPFDCAITSRHCGVITIADLDLPPHRIQRTPSLVARTEAPFFKVTWQVSGETEFEQDGRRTIFRAGTWCIYDTSKPYVVDVRERSRYVVFMVPQSYAFGWRKHAELLFGVPLLSHGTSRAALSAITSLLRDGAILDETTQGVVQDSVTALIEAGFRSADVSTQPARLGRAKLATIEDYIEANLPNAALRPDDIAQAAGVSRRTLYNLFQEMGETPHSYIQAKRLQRAQQLLADPRYAGVGVTAIAYDVGFADAAHFSRLFRERFGITPSEWRVRAMPAEVVLN